MKLQEFSLTVNKTAIYGAFLQPATPKHIVVLVHGLGEHSHRYLDGIIPTLVEQANAVFIFDNYGHGRSGGKRGHCPSYKALMDVMAAVIARAKSHFPDIPILLYGHSMGGNLALNYGLRFGGIAGLMITSPYLRLAFSPPRWKMKLGKSLLRFWPSFTLPSGLDPEGISRIPEEVKKYREDPLIHDLVSPMFSFPIMDAGEWVLANASALSQPLLLMHGMSDPIIDFNASKILANKAPNVTFIPFEGGYHELQHDLCRDEVFESIRHWLGKNFP